MKKGHVKELNDLLSQYGHLNCRTDGDPHHGAVNVIIALIIEGNNDEIGALTGKLGSIKGVMVRSSIAQQLYNHRGKPMNPPILRF